MTITLRSRACDGQAVRLPSGPHGVTACKAAPGNVVVA
jgi:hypothetical protein